MVFFLFKRIHKKDQWNRIEGPEIDPHAIVNKSLTEAQRQYASLFNKWCWNDWISHVRKRNLDTDLTTFMKVNSVWTRDPNIKCKTIKLLEDDIGEKLDDLGYNNDFLGRILKSQSMKEIIDKLELLKCKTFPLQKMVSREWEDNIQTERKYLKKTHTWKRTVFQNIQKKKKQNLLKCKNKKTN